ncbi:hypothetical protein B0H14DRAFT_2603495 [Mycena olivaceomarginata]|nr:hypothetical protein B0H14DRAFT_2603495 [Mycena olivaceomarginata]
MLQMWGVNFVQQWGGGFSEQIFGVDKEDLKGLNIALDSKQQELELVPQTPHGRTRDGRLKTRVEDPARRDSAVFKTRSIGSRAPSVFGARPGPRKDFWKGRCESALSDGKCTRESGTDGL